MTAALVGSGIARRERQAVADRSRFCRFDPQHLWGFEVHPNQGPVSEALLGPGNAEYLARGPAVTQLAGDVAVACAGIVPQWYGRAIAWAAFSALISPPQFLLAFRATKQFLEWHQRYREYRRIEATILESYKIGHRWMRMLGFMPEGLMQNYLDNEAHRLYARVA